MPTTDLAITRDEMVYSALRLVGAYNSFSTPKPQQVSDATMALKMLIKTFQADEELWLKEFVTIFLQSGVASYDLPGCYGTNELFETTVSVISAGSVTVTSVENMTETSVVGVVLDDGTIHWSVVTDISGKVVTLATSLASTASAGNVVYTYKSSLYRPRKISTAICNISGIGHDLSSIGRKQYAEKSVKDTTGVTREYYYDPQLTTGKLYIYPVPSDDSSKLEMTFDRPIELPSSSTDVFDMPDEYMELVKYGLAIRLAPEYAITYTELAYFMKVYTQIYTQVAVRDTEHTSLYMSPRIS